MDLDPADKKQEKTLPKVCSPITVLVVDDEPAVLRVIEKELASESYHLITTGDAFQALDILETCRVGVVVTDFRMPGLFGTELITILQDKWPDAIPILMLTLRDRDKSLEKECMDQAFRCIAKPWEFKELRHTITSALEVHSLRVENRELRQQLEQQREELESRQDPPHHDAKHKQAHAKDWEAEHSEEVSESIASQIA